MYVYICIYIQIYHYIHIYHYIIIYIFIVIYPHNLQLGSTSPDLDPLCLIPGFDARRLTGWTPQDLEVGIGNEGIGWIMIP